MIVTMRLLQRSPNQLAEHDQQVHGCEHEARASNQRVPRSEHAGISAHRVRLRREAAHQAEELADEAVQTRQAEACQREEHHEERPHRHALEQAAQLVHVLRVVALVDHADAEEQRAGRETVVDHVHHRARCADRVQREQAEHAEAEVAHRAVRDELLRIMLDPADERRVHDADDAQDREELIELDHAHGRGRKRDPIDAVRAELEQRACEDDRARRRSLVVRERQPCVHGEERHLHRKAGHEQDEHPVLLRRAELGRGEVRERCEVERPGAACRGRILRRDVDHAREREHRAKERVQEELDRSRAPFGAAVDRDQEVHRHQRELVRRVEHDRIAREEHAEHRRLQQEEPRVVLALALLDRGERADHRERHEERREQDQHRADGVCAEAEVHAERRHDREAQFARSDRAVGPAREAPRKRDGDGEDDERRRRGDPLGEPLRRQCHEARREQGKDQKERSEG